VRSGTLRKALLGFALLLLPVMALFTIYQPYGVDGDSVAYMDIADLLRTHQWAGVVNGYWNPLYPFALAVAQRLFHPARLSEFVAYRAINLLIFVAQVLAMLFFVAALTKLRARWPSLDSGTSPHQTAEEPYLLSRPALQLLGLGMLTIAAQRELSIAALKPDALLQALMLFAFAFLLECLASGSFLSAGLMGLCFGLAYLAKSFAFLVTFLSVGVLVLSLAWLGRRTLSRVLPRIVSLAALTLVVFASVAGPYIAALSSQKHRFDFGDSGALNFAWYTGDTEKLHVEPWMKTEFGSATVHLVHPEAQLLTKPGIYSYRAEPYGTYPDWFDPSFFHDHTVPHIKFRSLLRRDVRNAVLVLRYLLNHPEGLILFALLLATGGRLSVRRTSRTVPFWLPIVLLSLAMWLLYGIVNVEERYVTLAFLVLLLPLFAALRERPPLAGELTPEEDSWGRRAAAGMVCLLAFLALGEALRTALELRRTTPPSQPAWYSPQVYGAAQGLAALGIQPGDEIACMGTLACVYDHYWMRLAGVRSPTEVFNPDPEHLAEQWNGLDNKAQVENILRSQGARVLVAVFATGGVFADTAGPPGWIRLGHTSFYALPLDSKLNVQTPTGAAQATLPAPATMPWPGHRTVAP